VREVLRIARWRRRTRGHKPFHPSHAGFWPLAARLHTSRPPSTSNGSFAVLLVHRRPANIDLQIRAALHAPSIGQVVVSCNNPEVILRDWTGITSPRLRVQQEAGRNQTRRYAVALESGGDRFVLPDDDVLFLPDALDEFCRSLPNDAAHPLGLAGQRYGASGVWESAIFGTGEEVDVLNRAYVCTRAHAEGVFRNAELLGWSEEETFSNPADDVLVSFAGTSCPTVVDVDHVNCISHSDSQISTYRQADFHPARAEWVTQLRKALDRAPASRDQALGGAMVARHGVRAAINAAARPLRNRFYQGKNTQPLSVLPLPVLRSLGLDDHRALRTKRVQIGVAPAPLQGFFKIDERPTLPDLAACSPLWQVGFKGGPALDIVAFGALDCLPPHLVPLAIASWRGIASEGARIILGVRESASVLASRDALLGARSWASQLPSAQEILTSPLQLIDRGLHSTLWDEKRLVDALTSQGFDVVACISDGSSIEAHSAVSPWLLELNGEEHVLDPVPAALDAAADLIVVARAR
jgi:hypothetical protein